MDVGHPVTLPSGACGIIAVKHKNGMTDVDLIGGSSVRVPFKSLGDYFDTHIRGEAQMDPGTVSSEIVRVIHNQKRELCAGELFKHGNFHSKEGLAVELSRLSRAEDSPVDRKKRPGDSTFFYFLKPGVEIDRWIKKGKNGHEHPVAALDIPSFADNKPAELRPLKTESAPLTTGAINAAAKHDHVTSIAAAPKPVEIPPVAATMKAEPSEKIGQLKAPADAPLPESLSLSTAPPLVTVWKGEDTEYNDPIDVDIDTLFVGLLLRLPRGKTRWTKAQREAWLTMFNAAADFVYPESR